MVPEMGLESTGDYPYRASHPSGGMEGRVGEYVTFFGLLAVSYRGIEALDTVTRYHVIFKI